MAKAGTIFSMLRWLVVMLSVYMLSACGFHLQGHNSTQTVVDVPPLHMVIKERDPRLRATLQSSLTRQGITQSVLGPKLVVKRLRIDSRDISLTTRREATEKELILTLVYSVDDRTESLNSSRVYTHNPNAILSSDRQRAQLEQDMIYELSNRMLQQVVTWLQQPEYHQTTP